MANEPLRVAAELAALQIGQSVVINNGMIEVVRIPEGYLYKVFDYRFERTGEHSYTPNCLVASCIFVPSP